MTTFNDGKQMTKPANEDRPSSAVFFKAINYPPEYPDNKSREKCNKKEEKQKTCHPMQSATTTPSINNPDHTQ